MCLGECEIRSTMSFAFSLATYPICLKARPYWFSDTSSSVSSRCSSECSSICTVMGNSRYIHILPCTASMCAGADWGGWCNLTGLDVLWRFVEAQVDTVSVDMLIKPKVCICVHVMCSSSPLGSLWRKKDTFASYLLNYCYIKECEMYFVA